MIKTAVSGGLITQQANLFPGEESRSAADKPFYTEGNHFLAKKSFPDHVQIMRSCLPDHSGVDIRMVQIIFNALHGIFSEVGHGRNKGGIGIPFGENRTDMFGRSCAA